MRGTWSGNNNVENVRYAKQLTGLLPRDFLLVLCRIMRILIFDAAEKENCKDSLPSFHRPPISLRLFLIRMYFPGSLLCSCFCAEALKTFLDLSSSFGTLCTCVDREDTQKWAFFHTYTHKFHHRSPSPPPPPNVERGLNPR